MNNRKEFERECNMFFRLSELSTMRSRMKGKGTFTANVVTFGFYTFYYTTHIILENGARKFLKKRSFNPNQKSYVNNTYLMTKNQWDKKESSPACMPRINYGVEYYHQSRVIDCVLT